MNKTVFISFVLFFFGKQICLSQNVTIRCVAEEYSGRSLSFYYEEDFLTHKKKTVATFSPDYDGKFEVKFPLGQTQKLIVELGAFNGVLFAEPGKDYDLVFPPRTDKSSKEAYNPYFVPQEVFLGVLNQNQQDLNAHIANLEDSIASRLEPGLVILRRTSNKKALEKILARMDSFFVDVKNPFFNQYKEYRYHDLRHFVYMRDNERILDKYFADAPILLNVPTYTSLFEKLAKHGLTLKASKKKWSAYYTIEKDLGIKGLRDSLDRFSYLRKRKFLDLYLINGLHNVYHNKNFTQEKVLNLLGELQENVSPELQEFATGVYKKMAHLREGSLAPDITLYNEQGEKVRLSEFSGKFIYLNFGTEWSVPFAKELELLKKLNDKRVKDLIILTVSMDNDFNKMLKLKKDNNYSWTFLHFDFDPEVAEKYRVKVYPTYYLIGPDGSLVMSPAPSIAENFLEIFFGIYKKWQRDQYKIQQGIKN